MSCLPWTTGSGLARHPPRSVPPAMMLMKCTEEGQATPAGLAEKTGVDRATISGLFDGLGEGGMVRGRARSARSTFDSSSSYLGGPNLPR